MCSAYKLNKQGDRKQQNSVKQLSFNKKYQLKNIARRNINNLRYADDTSLMAEGKEELKSVWIRVKEESERAGLRLNIKKAKIMASSPITA